MTSVEIRGGADEYEAAVIAAVFLRLLDERAAARAVLPPRRRPSAWVSAYQDPHPDDPYDSIRPERRGQLPAR
ncbi:MAG TPA: hypothetical protein VJQ57_12360 [Acidimicrobiia bacterium]|nr:hypothetical protein [Acidimicrobiia bacterium]